MFRTPEKKELIRERSDSFPPYLEFIPLLEAPLAHRFILRNGHEAQDLSQCGFFHKTACVQAEQIHGNLVVNVSAKDQDRIIPQADALITQSKQLSLVIRTADCGPVYFYDPVQQSIGLAHSGKKGTEQNITGQVIKKLQQDFGSQPQDLIVFLGPCIRPPHYEIDFAAEIGNQARASGVIHYYDCQLNTAADLKKFYSYRMEKGKTGRHYSLLALR